MLRDDTSQNGSQLKWYQSIRLPLTAGVVVLYIVIFIFLGNIFSNTWRNYWSSQRITEATRYANFIASEISYHESEETMLDADVISGIHGFSRMYRYLRILIIDETGRVVLDTSQSGVGRYIVNDEVLSALSGQTSQAGTDEVERIAVPITNSSGSTVRGVVYAFINMESVQLSLQAGREQIVLILVVAAIVAGLLSYLLLRYMTKPLARLVSWTKGLKNSDDPEDLKKPEFRFHNEYSEIADSVEDVTHDMLLTDRSRSEFVSNVSHELKTPLSSIKVLTESLLLQKGVPEDTYREFLQDINQEIDRMNSIVSDLLTLVRLEGSGKNVLNLTTFSLGDMAEDVARRMKPLADQKQVSMNVEIVHPVQIQADENKLTLALTNLVQNAIKYNKDGGSVTVRIDGNAIYALIVVSDTGIGIDEEYYDKLFERFYRVDKARNRDEGVGGTGLGLSIVKQIVTLHKGSITVSSVVGEGSSFSIKMPLVQAGDTEEEE